MKKALTIFSLILILATLTACSGDTQQTKTAAQPTTNQPAVNTAAPTSEAAPQTSPPAETLSYPAPDEANSSQATSANPNSYPAQGQTLTEQPSIILQPGEIPAAPADAPAPDSGKASVSGTLFSFAGRRILAGTAFYLSPAVGTEKKDPPPILSGPNKENGDINSWADEKGQFSINNIPPGNYYLIVAAPMDWIVAEKSKDDAAPLLIELKADQRLALGVVQVPY